MKAKEIGVGEIRNIKTCIGKIKIIAINQDGCEQCIFRYYDCERDHNIPACAKNKIIFKRYTNPRNSKGQFIKIS